MNIPSGVTISEESTVTKIDIQNYGETLFLMQIILMFLPLAGLTGYFIYADSSGYYFTIPLLAGLVYWMLLTVTDNYSIHITDKSLSIIKGLHKTEILKTNLVEIESFHITRKTGKVYTSPKTGLTVGTPNFDELFINLKKGRFFISDSMSYHTMVFVKNTIMKRKETAKLNSIS